MSDALAAFKLYKHPLLTADEEIELGRLVQKMIPLLSKPHDELSREEKIIIRRGQRARNRMVEGNLRLVLSCARKYQNSSIHMSMADLVQEGNIGLCRAAEKFDPSRGYKFSTYAYWWIRQGISRALRDKERTIRIPCNHYDYVQRAVKWRDEYLSKEGKQPTMDQIAEAVGCPNPSMLRKALTAYAPVRSLDAPTNTPGENLRLIDVIADTSDGTCLEDDVFLRCDRELLMAKLGELKEEQRGLLEKYYGFNDEPATYLTIAKEYGVSREAARNRVGAAQKALRLKINGSI